MKTIIAGSTAELAAALKVATGDTQILLRAGTYSNVKITNINPTANVTIGSYDAKNHAVIDVASISKSSNLTFQDLTFKHNAAAGELSRSEVNIANSHDIKFIHNDIMGSVDNNFTNDGSGVEIRSSNRIEILDNKFHDLAHALFAHESSDLVLAGNDVRLVREGFDFAGVQDTLIDRNMFTDFRPNLTGTRPDHPDAIQVWTTNSTGSHDVQITNNAMLFGQGVAIQGIFISSQNGGVSSHSDFAIDNNLYEGQARNAIYLHRVEDSTVTNNTVLSAAKIGTSYYLDPAINTSYTTNTTLSDNISAMMVSNKDVGLKTSNNFDAFDYRSGKGATNAELFTKTITSKSAPNDFVAKAGSAAGAAHAGFHSVDVVGNWAKVSEGWLAKYDNLLDHPVANPHMG
jgi:hypothetical protein